MEIGKTTSSSTCWIIAFVKKKMWTQFGSRPLGGRQIRFVFIYKKKASGWGM